MANIIGKALIEGPNIFCRAVAQDLLKMAIPGPTTALELGQRFDAVSHGFGRFITQASLLGAPAVRLWKVYDAVTDLKRYYSNEGDVRPDPLDIFNLWLRLTKRLEAISPDIRRSAAERTMDEGGLLFAFPSSEGPVDATAGPARGLLDYVVLPAQRRHVREVQDIERRVWGADRFPEWGPNGLAYTRYDSLHRVYREGILVTPHEGRIIGYVGVEKLPSSALGLNMPPYDHDPRKWHNPVGDTLYILNHSVESDRKGVSRAIITHLLDRAKANGLSVSVIWNHEHPYLKPPDGAEKFWGGYGFKPLEGSVDPEWGPVQDGKKTGGELWVWSPNK